jgi:23S rRNA pseudouridine2605 synthase
MQERLQKYIARCGVCSRRKAEEYIALGRVRVNGKKITQMGYVVDSDKVDVQIDNEGIHPAVEMVYLMLNKPSGFITTASDPEERRTVYGLLPNLKERVFSVGRLDYDSEGLLLFTNDGNLTNRLTHPRYEIKKKYLVTVEGEVDRKTIASLARGIVLEDGKTAPAKIRILRSSRPVTLLELEMTEGKNRQIRRMLLAVGHPVIKLLRIQFGPLLLGNLKLGKYRFLSKPEIESLQLHHRDTKTQR